MGKIFNWNAARNTAGGAFVSRILTTTKMATATTTLFEAGGKELLDESVRNAAAESIEIVANEFLACEAPFLAKFITKQLGGGAKRLAEGVAPEVGKQVTGKAARIALKGVAHGAMLGVALDGVVGAGEGALAYWRGEMTWKEACSHTAKEAGKGGLASAAGMGLGTAAAVVLGPVAATPFLIGGIGAAGSILVRMGLNHIF